MDFAADLPLPLLPAGSVFQWGGVYRLPALCAELDIRRPLLVTDRGLAGSAVFSRIAEHLGTAAEMVAQFAEIDGNPRTEQVERGVAALRAGGHDGVVAFGGGSALDAGKAIAFASRQTRELHAFAFDRHGAQGPPPCETPIPWIAVPTTAGTGSEVSPSAVLTDATGAKRSIMHPAMQAPRVLCDPELTVGLPAAMTAWTGIDALSHCLEAFCVPAEDAEADAWAVAGLVRIRRSLLRACERGDDREARTDMLAAAVLGGRAFRKGLGGLHGLSHVLAARFGGQHGLMNAVLLPHVLAANRPAIDGRLAAIAQAAGLGDGADATVDWIAGLNSRLGIPATLAAIDMQCGDDDLAAICEAVVHEPNTATNPVPVDPAWAERVLRAAGAGEPHAAGIPPAQGSLSRPPGAGERGDGGREQDTQGGCGPDRESPR